jgi:hypothetical protein
MTKYVRETKAAQAIDVYVIMKGARHVATVQAYWSNAGTCLVNVHHTCGAREMQHGKASGYGYDKFTSALSGLVIDGHTMADHCGERLKPPKGKTYFPASYKPPRGYRLANGGEFDPDGIIRRPYHWRDLAIAELGTDEDWPAVERRAKELRAATDLMPGYAECYKESGLNYLTALGYTVIKGI